MIIDFNRYNGGGGSGSGVTPQDVQRQIDSALTPYWDSGETKDYVDEAVSGISLDAYYTSAQTDAAIAQAVSGLATEQYVQDALSGVNLDNYWTSAQTEEAITSKNYVVSGQVKTQIEAYNYVTSAETEAQILSKNYTTSAETKTYVDSAVTGVQDQIDTMDEVVSAALVDLNEKKVESEDIKHMVKLTQAQYDALVDKDPETFYIIVNSI